MIKKSKIVSLLLSLVFVFTGIFGVSASATLTKRAKLAYKIMNQHSIAWHHFMYGLMDLDLKINKSRLVDNKDFIKLDRKKKFLLGPRNVLKAVKEANDEGVTNFTSESFIEALDDYIKYANMFDKSFSRFMKKYKIEKKLGKEEKKYYKYSKKITSRMKAFLKAMVKTEKKKILEDDEDEDDDD